MKHNLILFAIIFIIASCEQKPQSTLAKSIDEVLVDTAAGQNPYLTKDDQGHPVLSWVRTNADSSFSFCYSSFEQGDFDEPVVIPNTSNIQPHGENLPKIIFKPSGEIIALWGISHADSPNKYAGLVYYSQSLDDGKNWTAPRSLVNDTTSYDQRYYDVALLKNGEVGIIWLDNRKTGTAEGSSLYYATTEGKKGFANEKRIAESCCQCCRTDLFIDTKDNIHILYRGIIEDSVRDMIHIVSTDNAKTFSKPQRISDDNWAINACPHTGPSMAENAMGLQFAWYTGGKNKGCYYASSSDNGAHFTPRSLLSTSGSHPQIITLNDGSLLTLWDETAMNDNNYYQRIAGVYKNAEGKNIATGYLTNDKLSSTFPVATVVDDETIMVAFTQRRNNRTYVKCVLVRP